MFCFVFNSKNRRINLNSMLKVEEKKEQNAAHNQIDEERVIAIQATIVRIMKARKVLNHQNLVAEVIAQLSARFKPQVSIIKVPYNYLINFSENTLFI